MVNSVNPANKLALQNSSLIAAVEKQFAPTWELLKQAAAVDAGPILKAFERAYKPSVDYSRLLVNPDGILAAIRTAAPESIGLPPGWNDILSMVSKPTIDPTSIESLLAKTDELEEEVQAVQVAKSVQEFFESQPDLAVHRRSSCPSSGPQRR